MVFFGIKAIISQKLDYSQIIFYIPKHHGSLSYYILSVNFKGQRSTFRRRDMLKTIF